MTEKSTAKRIYDELCDTYKHQCRVCRHEWETKNAKPSMCANTECKSNTKYNEENHNEDRMLLDSDEAATENPSTNIESTLKLDFYTTEFHYSWDEVKESMDDATNAKETLVGATKFAGKILANTGLTLGKTSFFAAKHTVKNLPSIVAGVATSVLEKGNGKLSNEQTDRLKETVEKNKGRKLF
jgi:hypothetical protein